MILPAILLVFASACTSDGIDKEQPEPTTCEPGFILDGSSCVPESCGTGRWGNLPVDDDTVYVDISSPEDGDGTEANPFWSIQEGGDAAGSKGGGMVAIAAGSYPESLLLTPDHDGVHIAGRCQEMVTLDASVGDMVGIVLALESGETKLSGITVSRSKREGVMVMTGSLDMKEVKIVGNGRYGVLAYQLSSLPIALSMDSCVVEGNTGTGILTQGSQATLRNTIVKDTQPDASGEFGWGIGVQNGATLTAEGCTIEGNTEVGIGVIGEDTQVTLMGTTVNDTRFNIDDRGGYGIYLEGGAILLATDSSIVGNALYGVAVYDGAFFHADGCLVDDNGYIGLWASQTGTLVELVESTVSNTRPWFFQPFGYGWGIEVQDGAVLSLEKCTIDGNTRIGVGVSRFFPDRPPSKVTIHDSIIANTRAGTDIAAASGIGAGVFGQGSISVADTLFQSNQGPGIMSYGRNAMFECTGCMIEGSQFAGATAIFGGTMKISDSIIEGTIPSPNLLGGAGIYGWRAGDLPPTIILSDSLIQDNPVAGVWLIGPVRTILEGNTISGGSGEPFGSGSRCGDAVLVTEGATAWDGRGGLLLRDNLLRDSSGAGIFLDGSSALLDGNAYAGNAVDLIVQNQSCDPTPDSYSEAPDSIHCPTYNYPTCNAKFFFQAMPAELEDGK